VIEHNIPQDSWKQMAGTAAVKLIEDGMLVGLGTGSTSNFMIYALGQRLQAGLHIAGAVATSQASRDLAENLGIPMTNLDTHAELDLYIDGTDEIDTQLNLLKGAGGALVREKIVASASRRFVVIADITKQVLHLGQKFPIPVEVTPFAATPVRKHLEALGASISIRQVAGSTFITENNNIIIDCAFPGGIAEPITLDTNMHSIVGVVKTGLFHNMEAQAIIGGPDRIQTIP